MDELYEDVMLYGCISHVQSMATFFFALCLFRNDMHTRYIKDSAQEVNISFFKKVEIFTLCTKPSIYLGRKLLNI